MPTKKHDPTLWLESDSDLSSEPSDLPNAQLSEVDAVCVKAVFERLFQRLRLLDLLKVDAGEQVRAVHRAESRGAATPPSRRRNRANPNPERARTRSASMKRRHAFERTRRRPSRTPSDIARSYSHRPLPRAPQTRRLLRCPAAWAPRSRA
jgi:hypothetical protein